MTNLDDTRITRRRRNQPVWNLHPFSCPGCSRHFAQTTIRIVKHEGQWYCHRCQLELTNATTHERGTQVASTAELATTPCHTCGVPFKNRRITVNINGQLVHYRCPPKKKSHPR